MSDQKDSIYCLVPLLLLFSPSSRLSLDFSRSPPVNNCNKRVKYKQISWLEKWRRWWRGVIILTENTQLNLADRKVGGLTDGKISIFLTPRLITLIQ